jgi:hypothetical protein
MRLLYACSVRQAVERRRYDYKGKHAVAIPGLDMKTYGLIPKPTRNCILE